MTTRTPTEYPSVFHPFDAEAVQGKDRMNPLTGEGLQRINAFINHHLSGCKLNPHSSIAELKVKLNHLNLDFPFTSQTPVSNTNSFEVSHGDVFGTTPQTDLMKEFDYGKDLPKYSLNIDLAKTEDGFSMTGKLSPANQEMHEAVEYNFKKKKRLEKVKKMIDKKKNK